MLHPAQRKRRPMSLAHSIPSSKILLLIKQMLINPVLITRPRRAQRRLKNNQRRLFVRFS
jgi:hypothetical protein